MNEPADLYVVMGNPIAHSQSPAIHAWFAEQTGQRIVYERRLVPVGEFEAALAVLIAEGARGANVTLPFKQDAWRAAGERSEAAERAGAVNTLTFEASGRIRGDNTDGVGLVRDLTDNLGLALSGRRILMLGAGGAARGVLQPLLALHPSELVIANRTPARAQQLAAAFADLGPVAGCGFEAMPAYAFDLVLNATSASLDGVLPPLRASQVGADSACYDMAYGAEPTPFVRWAREAGAGLASDGLGMLVEQAAESFHLWRGLRPRTAPVMEALRLALGARGAA